MLVGYARVSTVDQETALQRDALDAAGVRTVFEEKASGVSARPELQRMLSSLRRGDTLVVWKLDRIARSLPDLLDVLRRVSSMGCSFRSLTEPIDTTTPIGEFVLQVLGAIAQLERAMIRERTIAGQVAFAKRGGVFGRPKKLTLEQEGLVLQRLRSGATQSATAREFGVSLIVVRRVLAESRGEKTTGKLPVLRKYL